MCTLQIVINIHSCLQWQRVSDGAVIGLKMLNNGAKNKHSINFVQFSANTFYTAFVDIVKI